MTEDGADEEYIHVLPCPKCYADLEVVAAWRADEIRIFICKKCTKGCSISHAEANRLLLVMARRLSLDYSKGEDKGIVRRKPLIFGSNN